MWWYAHYLGVVTRVVPHQRNRSVNLVLTSIPVGILAQYTFTLTLPWVSDSLYQL